MIFTFQLGLYLQAKMAPQTRRSAEQVVASGDAQDTATGQAMNGPQENLDAQPRGATILFWENPLYTIGKTVNPLYTIVSNCGEPHVS